MEGQGHVGAGTSEQMVEAARVRVGTEGAQSGKAEVTTGCWMKGRRRALTECPAPLPPAECQLPREAKPKGGLPPHSQAPGHTGWGPGPCHYPIDLSWHCALCQEVGLLCVQHNPVKVQPPGRAWVAHTGTRSPRSQVPSHVTAPALLVWPGLPRTGEGTQAPNPKPAHKLVPPATWRERSCGPATLAHDEGVWEAGGVNVQSSSRCSQVPATRDASSPATARTPVSPRTRACRSLRHSFLPFRPPAHGLAEAPGRPPLWGGGVPARPTRPPAPPAHLVPPGRQSGPWGSSGAPAQPTPARRSARTRGRDGQAGTQRRGKGQ